MSDGDFSVRPISETDRPWVEATLEEFWGSTLMVSRGVLHDIPAQPGFLAVAEDGPCGLITYTIAGDQCEITLIQSVRDGAGVGSALLEAVRRAAGCRRLWLITTNDNLPALGFYQRRRFTLVAVHPNALEASRKLKPQIPATGLDGIPLRDEIELEMLL